MSTEFGPRPVVVGVDGSTGSTYAVRWAARQAALWECPLRLVHAHTWPWIQQPYLAGLPSHYRQALLSMADEWLRKAAGLAVEAVPEIAVSTELISATAAQLLVEESQRARLVVVGSRGLGGFTGLLAGSTAVALGAHAHCPVAVVRTLGENWVPPVSGSVVVGVDGSPSSEVAIAFAFEAASLRGARLVALHAWVDVTVPDFVPMRPVRGWPTVEDDERRLLAERLAGWQDKYPDVQVDRVIVQGRPAYNLLRAAEDAQIVVVGTRGRGGLRGLLLGSTSHAMLHHAPCPVVVARS